MNHNYFHRSGYYRGSPKKTVGNFCFQVFLTRLECFSTVMIAEIGRFKVGFVPLDVTYLLETLFYLLYVIVKWDFLCGSKNDLSISMLLLVLKLLPVFRVKICPMFWAVSAHLQNDNTLWIQWFCLFTDRYFDDVHTVPVTLSFIPH